MYCPTCKKQPLHAITLDEQLPAHHCNQCDGHFLKAGEYFNWLDQRAEIAPEKSYDGEPLQLVDKQAAIVCPVCTRIMQRYAVGHGTEVTLDQCGQCDGVWLDKNEWQALKGRNLHDEINQIFSPQWQQQIRKQQSEERLTVIYQKRFGADYARLLETQQWIAAHPNKAEILAFLSNPNPFKTV